MVINKSDYQLPSRRIIIVAMSGGVDSSVSAALFKDSGAIVIGITLKLFKNYEERFQNSLKHAKEVAKILGILHLQINCEKLFRSKVINYFVNSYANGLTPNPCAICNKEIKFGVLLYLAKFIFGASAFVTGHYVRKYDDVLLRSHYKDQSYFLFALSKNQISFSEFPIGSFNKSYVRELAEKFLLPVSRKRDSQDICFISGKYSNFLENFIKENSQGRIIDTNGNYLGIHDGVFHYTIGQKKSLKLQRNDLFVTKFNIGNNKDVIVGSYDDLKCCIVFLERVSFVRVLCIGEKYNLQVKLRSNHIPVPAIVILYDDKKGKVILESPEYGIASGQVCAFYEGVYLLGGGWIAGTSK